MQSPDLIKNICKGKEKVDEFEVGSGSKPSYTDEVPVHFEIMESVSEVEVLKNQLPYFKEKNRYINDSNEKTNDC